ncbi:hypothetical protein BT93_L2355 [Corymbia citriodora subsp. variegata]|uniref:Endonuclease/exonuclease/phosphatase domain-containing protein n=1 Tax=Corymbia citriodora subsp. variegata TaxID=360336 RepID=A0A8T0CKC0_CORYI|nr:hypothetical protein BT93_L2355 [Corymbia citriodora subsp. variegata]
MMDPVKQSEVKHFVRANDICCLGLMETKVPPHHFDSISSNLFLGWKWKANYDFSARGRIWVGWNPILVDFNCLYVSSQMIHDEIKFLHSGSFLHFTAVYGDHTFVARRPLWTDLIRLSPTLSDSPWMVCGDFNAIRDSSDRMGSPNTWPPSFDDLNECLFQAELEDLRYVGF